MNDSKDDLRDYLVQETNRWLPNYDPDRDSRDTEYYIDEDGSSDEYPYFYEYGYLDDSDSDGSYDNPGGWIEDILVAVYDKYKHEAGGGGVEDLFYISGVPNNSDWGMVSGSGFGCNDDIVTLVATPKDGYVFDKWLDSGDADHSGTSMSHTIDNGSAIYRAIFKHQE